jgi:hypothetical protein
MHGPVFLLPFTPLLPPSITNTTLSLPKIVVMTPAQFDSHFPGYKDWQQQQQRAGPL